MPVALVLMWETQFAYSIEGWRARCGKGIERWLHAVGEFESFCALATYAYENPADPFPEIVPVGPIFEGEGLGHPLLPRSQCVRNDLSLTGDLRVLVVSGSDARALPRTETSRAVAKQKSFDRFIMMGVNGSG